MSTYMQDLWISSYENAREEFELSDDEDQFRMTLHQLGFDNDDIEDEIRAAKGLPL